MDKTISKTTNLIHIGNQPYLKINQILKNLKNPGKVNL